MNDTMKRQISEIRFEKVCLNATDDKFPGFEALKNIIVNQLISYGYSICRVAPNVANCIIRAYHVSKFKLPDCTVNLFGAECIVSSYASWSKSSGQFKIDFANCIRQLQINGQIEEIQTDFVDYYVLIKFVHK